MGFSLGGLVKGIGKVAKTVAPVAAFIPGVGPLAAGALGVAGKFLGGKGIPGVSSVGGFLKDHGGDILAGVQGLNAYGQQNKANALENRGMEYATQSYDQRAPLRSMAVTRLQNEALPDLSSIYADSGNVYQKKRPTQGVTPIGGA